MKRIAWLTLLLLFVLSTGLLTRSARAQAFAARATLPNYSGATVSATSTTNAAHSSVASVAADGTVVLSVYPFESYTFGVSAVSATYPAFTTGRITISSLSYVAGVTITQALQTGAATVYVAPPPSSGTGSVSAADCTAQGKVVGGINSSGVIACVAGPAATVTSTSLQGLSPTFGVVTAAQVNGHYLADQAKSGATLNGMANLLTGPCAAGSGYSAAACDIMISPLYSPLEYSDYFTPEKSGNSAEQNMRFPTAGGIGRPRFAEDHRLGNRFYAAINPLWLQNNTINERTPFVFEVRTSNSSTYADNTGAGLFRTRVYDGHNYIVPGTPGTKQNFLGLATDGQVRSGGQGGGFFSNSLLHTSPGDDIAHVVQHDSNGCVEREDECNKLWRAFTETMTTRWGGTLNGTPVLDAAGFGNYSMFVTVSGGYNPQASGTDNMTVNLSQAYTAGNVTGMLPSPYPGTARVTGDTAANWLAQFGTSSAITTLTAPIDARHYDSACPSNVLDNGPLMPSPFLSNESGVGGVTAFCATVASTAGIIDGQTFWIVGPQGNLESARVVHKVDGTHMTVNVSNPHATGETIFVGGAQGLGISMLADDIAPGNLYNYPTQPTVTLHKFFPLVGSDSLGLYVYTNEAKAAEISTKAYQSVTPLAYAAIGSISTSGTAVTAVNLSNPGSYGTNTAPGTVYNYAGLGYQSVLAAPTLTWTGCTTPPTTTNTLVPGTGNPYGFGLKITVTDGGNCTSPSATLSTTWANPYRIAPLVMAKKVVDPATGSPNNGYLLVGALDPTKWHPTDLVEQSGWPHDVTGSQITLGKYYTGASRNFGIENVVYFTGDWGGFDIQNGFVNNTDGHNYYPDATHPIGPGVAYETPPDAFAFSGDYNNHVRFYTPPLTSLFDLGCGGPHIGADPYHPCKDNIATAYNLFSFHSTSTENYQLRYNPTGGSGVLSWNGLLQVASLQVGGVAIVPGGTENVIAYTAAPSLNATFAFNRIALSGAISPTIAAGTLGAKTCLVITHDATTNTYPITWPSNILGGNQPGSKANSHFKQCFDWQPTDNAFVANSVGLVY